MKTMLTALTLSGLLGNGLAAEPTASVERNEQRLPMSQTQELSGPQKAIAPIAAFAATGQLPQLHQALEQGLDAGLSISDCREILVQLYAYAGFPRSLNALSELMKVLQARQQRGIQDAEGRPVGPLPPREQLLAVGEHNQTQLVGAPVKGALFDFAPAIDQYLKAHLFGAIFARDNLDWKSRELATVAALAAMSGVESQLQSHLRISLNVGLTPAQLGQLPQVLIAQGAPEAAQRLTLALTASAEK